jgi:hypothetical protein
MHETAHYFYKQGQENMTLSQSIGFAVCQPARVRHAMPLLLPLVQIQYCGLFVPSQNELRKI